MELKNYGPSNPDLRRKLSLSNLDVFQVIEVARTFLSSLKGLQNIPGAKLDTSFTDLTRNEILESIRDISCQYQNHFGGPNCIRVYGLRLVDMKTIQQMLFDYDVFLAGMYGDYRGEVPSAIIECYDWSLCFRRKLSRKIIS